MGDQRHDQSSGWSPTQHNAVACIELASNDPVPAPANHHVMNPEQTEQLLSGHRYHPNAAHHFMIQSLDLLPVPGTVGSVSHDPRNLILCLYMCACAC